MVLRGIMFKTSSELQYIAKQISSFADNQKKQMYLANRLNQAIIPAMKQAKLFSLRTTLAKTLLKSHFVKLNIKNSQLLTNIQNVVKNLKIYPHCDD